MPEENGLEPIEEIKNGDAESPVVNGQSEKTPIPTPPPAPQPKPAPDAAAPPVPPAPPSPPVSPPSPAGKTAVKPGSAIIKRATSSGWLNYLLLALAVLAVLATAGYYLFYRVTFEINPQPTPDRILLDGREVKSGIYRTKPGIHSVVIEKEGYISYLQKRKYKFAERVKLNLNLEKEKSPVLSVEGGSRISFSQQKNLLFFLDKEGVISTLDTTKESAKPSALSNASYKNARDFKISKDADFALVLDSDAVKVVNFSKADLINQTQTNLPPAVALINSITWNNNASELFPQANSKILYDLKTDKTWDVFLADLPHTQAGIILQLDKNVFDSLHLDWSENPSKALVVGGEIGVLDIAKRDYKKIESDKKFVWGKWAPGADKAVAIDSEGGAWLYRNGALERLPFNSRKGLLDFVDTSTIGAIAGSRPVKFNFDTKQMSSYAEVRDLSQSLSFITKSDLFYFETAKGIYSARYEEAKY